MKAIQFKQFGGPEVLELVELKRPQPKGKEVLIEIKAIGVNFADIARREGQYVVPTPLPYVPGSEVAGVVCEVGDEVEQVKVGQRVVTLLGSKTATGYAEYTLSDERSLVPVPEGVDDRQAAALLVQGLTAYHVLKTSGQLQQGERVLVHAAAGGVGTLAVQLAKLFGAGQVIATASSEEKRQISLDLGADAAVDYTQDGWEQKVLELTDNQGVDVALEMVGGSVFHKTLSILAPFGRMVIYGLASQETPKFNPVKLMAKNHTVTGFFLPQIMRKQDLYLQSLKELLAYVQQGQLKLIIGGVYALEEAAKVQALMKGRQTTGKLILVP
ncbi:NADPH2:quinone reductase [Caldalkalibacillus uzonensis]|uniref:NADPH2:quinone reductase n=1 Tax=Caldalkalibacillus uzonensis TaxID=353224 RepID=A0ABU0CWT8_9BACI|nr:quinone oxidoreductase [Caldalkalibacillus uzonensis]MDQ0340885.1 NADPH2:quinone reductase [Caldalkalibacillus uzonensis]